MVTHSMENILNMQYYAPVSSDEALHSPPSRKKRCLAKEVCVCVCACRRESSVIFPE